MVPWSTVQSLAIFFGPILLPRALAFYRSIRAPSSVPPQPLPTQTAYALNILFVSALVCLITTLPYFTPPNIFVLTASRLQTPTNVLFARLGAMKWLRNLSLSDVALRDVFEAGGLEARLLYLRFGPAVLSSSAHLIPDPKARDAPLAYLLYALPDLLAPHLLHVLVLGLVTSISVGGAPAAQWRTPALISATVLAAADTASLAAYDHSVNARALRPADLDPFFWKRRLVSRLLICGLDALLGWAVYLTATRRAFATPLSSAERLEASTRSLEQMLGRLRGLGALRNVVFRDTMLRGKMERYWVGEQEVMRDVFEDREVVRALNEALGRVDVGAVEREAGAYTDAVLGNVGVGGPEVEGVA